GLAALVLGTACSNDPSGACAFDNSVQTGGGCAVPQATIAVDGDPADWAAIAQRPCSTCEPGDVAQIRAARTSDGRIAFVLDTIGPPSAVADRSYQLSLGPLREPSYWLDIRVQPGAAAVV